ncbi:MAG TPA: glycosyltransferase [Microlunatus sp.]
MTVRVLDTEAHSAPRIACYSHDTVGLGHTRRNIAVATSMINSWPGANAMMITGNPEATSLWLPPRTDVVTLPTVTKDTAGRYRSRTLNASLDSVVHMRSALIEAAVTSFAPDLLIVDKVPLGVAGELTPALRRLRAEHDTKIVLGLREILDDPLSAVAEWARSGATETIEEFYDAVWIYGDRLVYDPIVEYGLPDSVADRCVFTGYLAADRFLETGGAATIPEPAAEPYVLCTVGGGQDGAELARTFAATPLPAGHDGIVVCGPFMTEVDREAVHAAAEAMPQMTSVDFVPDLHRLIGGAAAVVSMAGYNSVCEVLATDRPALLVPRTAPRTEQLLRARRLADLGAADLLPPERLDVRRLAEWTAAAVAGARPCAASRAGVDIDGLRRLPTIAERLLTTVPARTTTAPRTARRGVDHRAA